MGQGGYIAAERFTDLTQNFEGEVALTPLHAADIRSVDPRVIGKFFLCPPDGLSLVPDALSELFEDFLIHGYIVTE